MTVITTYATMESFLIQYKNKHSGKQRSAVLLFVNTDTLEVKEEVLYTRKHVVVFMFTT